MLRIELMESPIGNNKRNRATVQALGLRKVHAVVYRQDSPSLRGMIHHVAHMLQVTAVDGTGLAVSKLSHADRTAASRAKSKSRAEKSRARNRQKPVQAGPTEQAKAETTSTPKPVSNAAPADAKPAGRKSGATTKTTAKPKQVRADTSTKKPAGKPAAKRPAKTEEK